MSAPVPSQSLLFFLETLDLIGSTTVLGALYGIAFTLYCLCVQSLYLQFREPDKRRQARFTIGYISFQFFCATAFLALNARAMQLAYIDHADFPGGPWIYENSNHPTFRPYMTAGNTLDLTLQTLTMAIQIWRLPIIWGQTRYAVAVTIPPLLLLLCYIILYVIDGILSNFKPLDQLGISQSISTAMGTTQYGILPALTILVTGLVIGRILLARWRVVKILGTSYASGPYMSVVAMLTESYALESAWSIVSVVLFSLHHPAFIFFRTNDSIVKVIAYFLVVYRVATGRGWTRQTEQKITTLQWNRGPQAATGEIGGSGVSATPIAIEKEFPRVSNSESSV